MDVLCCVSFNCAAPEFVSLWHIFEKVESENLDSSLDESFEILEDLSRVLQIKELELEKIESEKLRTSQDAEEFCEFFACHVRSAARKRFPPLTSFLFFSQL